MNFSYDDQSLVLCIDHVCCDYCRMSTPMCSVSKKQGLKLWRLISEYLVYMCIIFTLQFTVEMNINFTVGILGTVCLPM